MRLSGAFLPLRLRLRGPRGSVPDWLTRADARHPPREALNRAVSRNPDRFPEDFVFRLTPEEAESLRFQSGTSNKGRGGRRCLPHVFTEHGVAMLASVLNSGRAVQMSILIIRALFPMREAVAAHKDVFGRNPRG
jgi:hypothetical protein